MSENPEKPKRIEIQLAPDVYKKFEDAVAELNHVQRIMTFEPRTLIAQVLSTEDYEDLINNTLLHVDKLLMEQREALKSRRKKGAEPKS
ncbi:MAG: hypothetical protein SFY92_00665 [Verrucomicrobiae bacterium]|nr:hypothetical protein [Verrucomicrobiae bacterium]